MYSIIYTLVLVYQYSTDMGNRWVHVLQNVIQNLCDVLSTSRLYKYKHKHLIFIKYLHTMYMYILAQLTITIIKILIHMYQRVVIIIVLKQN